MADCPTCNGTGSVPQHVADALQGVTGKQRPTCRCDGPPHPWDPSWCPATGPIGGR